MKSDIYIHYDKAHTYVECTYFYKQKTIQNFLISSSTKYHGTKETPTTIMRRLVPVLC